MINHLTIFSGHLRRRTFTTARTSYPSYGSTKATDPYFRTTHTIEQYRHQWNDVLDNGSRKQESDDISLAGRVVSKREASKKLYFIDIESNGARVQVMSDERHVDQNRFDHTSDAESTATETTSTTTTTTSTTPTTISSSFHNDGAFQEFRSSHKELQRGDIIGVTGFPAKTKKGELSIVPRSLHFLAPCLHELPAPGDPPPQDPNVRFRKRAADLLSNPQSKYILQTRFRCISLIRQYLESKGFVEAETPILNLNAGGAAARPFTTSSVALGSSAPPLHLRIAPELYLKQLVIGGFDRVFEIGKVFRNEGIDSTHNPEFTTCEFYQAYADYEDLMEMTEDMLSSIETSLLREGTDRDERTPAVFAGRPFPRMSVYDELERVLNQQLPPPDELEDTSAVEALIVACDRGNVPIPSEGRIGGWSASKVLDNMIGHCLEPLCVEPTFLCDHPAVMSPLANMHRSRPGLTERFELFVNGNELCNAYAELNNPMEQRRRFEQQAKMQNFYGHDVEIPAKDEAFCDALEYGLPPTAGWGIGVDRLVMLLTGQQHIREVLPFVLIKPTE